MLDIYGTHTTTTAWDLLLFQCLICLHCSCVQIHILLEAMNFGTGVWYHSSRILSRPEIFDSRLSHQTKAHRKYSIHLHLQEMERMRNRSSTSCATRENDLPSPCCLHGRSVEYLQETLIFLFFFTDLREGGGRVGVGLVVPLCLGGQRDSCTRIKFWRQPWSQNGLVLSMKDHEGSFF